MAGLRNGGRQGNVFRKEAPTTKFTCRYEAQRKSCPLQRLVGRWPPMRLDGPGLLDGRLILIAVQQALHCQPQEEARDEKRAGHGRLVEPRVVFGPDWKDDKKREDRACKHDRA